MEFHKPSTSSVIILLLLFKSQILTLGFVSNQPAVRIVDNGNFCKIDSTTASHLNLYSNNNNNDRMVLQMNMSSSSSSSPQTSSNRKGLRKLLFQPFKKSPLKTAPIEPVVTDNIPRIGVKPRPLVSFDESSGKYIPQQQTQQQQGSNQYMTSKSSTSSSSGWSSFKDAVYNSFDSLSKIPKFIKRSKQNKSKRNLAVAYSDTVEFKSQDDFSSVSMFSSSTTTTTKQNKNTANQKSVTPAAQLVKQYESSLAASSNDRSNGEDLFRTDTRKSFDATKDGIYDFFTGKKKDVEQKSKPPSLDLDYNKPKKTPIQNLKLSQTTATVTDATSFRPVSKPSTNRDETVANLTPYLADLNSSNPVKVLKAKYAISLEEWKRNRRIQEQKRREAIDGIKQKVFTVVDAIQVFYSMILNLPKTIEDTIISIEETIEQTNTQVTKAAQDVQEIPSKIQKAVDDAKKSVDDTQKATLEVVNEVKSIPQKIEKSVADTKQSINDTKENVENFIHKVEDITFEAKVLMGLEKPKPKPLPPPPPPKTSNEIALEIAGAVAKTTGQAAFAVGKGTLGLTATAAKAAINVATAPKEKEARQDDGTKNAEVDQARVSLLSKFSKRVNSAKTGIAQSRVTAKSQQSLDIISPTTIGDIDELLEKEVADALRSAEEALENARREKKNPSTTLSSLEINEALAKARMAAAQARKDAEELELMLQKKNEYFMKS